jgi:hypothetical protein
VGLINKCLGSIDNDYSLNFGIKEVFSLLEAIDDGISEVNLINVLNEIQVRRGGKELSNAEFSKYFSRLDPFLTYADGKYKLSHKLFSSVEIVGLVEKTEDHIRQLHRLYIHNNETRSILLSSIRMIKQHFNWRMGGRTHGSVIAKDSVPSIINAIKNGDGSLLMKDLSSYLLQYLNLLVCIAPVVYRELVKRIQNEVNTENSEFWLEHSFNPIFRNEHPILCCSIINKIDSINPSLIEDIYGKELVTKKLYQAKNYQFLLFRTRKSISTFHSNSDKLNCSDINYDKFMGKIIPGTMLFYANAVVSNWTYSDFEDVIGVKIGFSSKDIFEYNKLFNITEESKDFNELIYKEIDNTLNVLGYQGITYIPKPDWDLAEAAFDDLLI